MADIFDQLAQNNGATAATAPVPQAANAPVQTTGVVTSQATPQPATAQQPSGDIFDQLAAGQGTSPTTTTSTQPTYENPLAAQADIGSGVLKGAGETARFIARGLDYVPGMQGAGTAIANKLGLTDQNLQANNPMESGGKVLESILEGMLGDEALKGASIGDKLMQGAKLAEKYENASPFVKSLIERGLEAMRPAAVAGGETLAKGGTPTQAAAAAGTAGVLSAAAPAVTAGVSKAWNTVTGRALQAELQTGIGSVLANTASDAEVEPAAATFRNSAEALADAVQEKAKGLYDTIDAATDGQFTNVQNAMRNVQSKLREIVGTDDALESRLEDKLEQLKANADGLIEQATKNGVDPDIADDARNAWRQQSALTDLDAQIKASTFGDGVHAREVVDPKKLVGRVQKLADSGRLSDALGDDNADELLQHVYDMNQAAKAHGLVVSAGKKAAGAAGVGALAGLGFEGVKAAR